MITRALVAIAGFAVGFGVLAQDWRAIGNDQLHDPKSPAVRFLQNPGEALSRLPPDNAGNQVRWVEALEKALISPRTNLLERTQVRVYEKDVLLNLYGSMPVVRFPHRQHTLWLDCSNCHDHLFKEAAGATRFSMLSILDGEQCGLCHGAVSFPLTECERCHSVSRRDYQPLPKLRAVVVERGELPPSPTAR